MLVKALPPEASKPSVSRPTRETSTVPAAIIQIRAMRSLLPIRYATIMEVIA
ncbi:hypothetical protein [Nonomuraea dietziae]|uniref:hypothetical protein n=1 Tax=Nonomuraea dietziae TaxID=65515 RepID=UPI0031D1397D